MKNRIWLAVMFCFLSFSIVATAEIGFSGNPTYDKATDSWHCKGYAGGVDAGEVLDWGLWQYSETAGDYVLVDAGYVQANGMTFNWGYGGLESGKYMIWVVSPYGSESQKKFTAE